MSFPLAEENWDKWHSRAVCLECGWHTYAPFGDPFHTHAIKDCCPQCGNEGYPFPSTLSARFAFYDRWDIRRMRWVSQSRILKPSTWGSGYWETLKESKEK